MSTNAAESNAGNDEFDLIWGAKAIGARLNLTPREAFYQLEAGRIPGARKWGRKWSASGAVLRRVLTGEVPPIDV